MTTREAAYAALLTKLQGISTSTIKTVTRRQPEWTNISGDSNPTLWLNQISENMTQSKGSPGIVDLTCMAVLYTDAGNQADAVKSTQINNCLDAIDAILAPDPVSGFQTLGGLVIHAWREGLTQIAEGLLAENALTAAPIHMRIVQDAIGQGVYWFDSGTLWLVPQQNQAGATPSDLTPIRVGNLKGVHLDFSFKINYPGTQLQAPVNAGIYQMRMSGKAMIGTFNGRYLSQAIFGQNFAAGAELADTDRAYTIPASPYQVTVTPPSSGTFVQDLGLAFTSDGTFLQKVSGTPSSGQYSLSGAVYTFAAADTGKDIALSYIYSITGGAKMLLLNQYAGIAPNLQLILKGTVNGRDVLYIVKKIVPKTFTVPTTLEAFSIPEFQFEAVADANGRFLEMNSSV